MCFIVPVIMIVVSCGNRPSNVLSEKKMVSLLADMEMAEAYVNTQGSSSNDERVEMGKRVLELHGVSEETLDTTLAWYGRNMDKYSELFDKVDAELLKRKKKYVQDEGLILVESDNLWPYSKHLVMSPLSGSDSFVFSFINAELDKGDILDFSFYMPNPTNMKGTLGVEYSDGYGDAVVSNFSNKKKIQMELQTDTSRKVMRIFGTMHIKDVKDLPLYLDSISLKVLPFDSLSYRNKRRSQKEFSNNIPVPVRKKTSVENTDSIPADSIISDSVSRIINTLSDSIPEKDSTVHKTVPKLINHHVSNPTSSMEKEDRSKPGNMQLKKKE